VVDLGGEGQREAPVGTGQQVPARSGDVDPASPEAVPLLGLLDVQVGVAAQEARELAGEVGGEVLDDEDGREEVGGQGGQDQAEGV